MNETEFNLLDEPWIRVMNEQCEIEEISLTDAIVNAHNYKSLKGELPTQDIAVMRLILAVLHTVFSRYDENGNKSPIENRKKSAVNRWRCLWENGQFPENAIREYLETWHERFWLFHPERPFFQAAGLEKGSQCSSAKLNGEISQSNNKIRFFSSYSGEEKEKMSFSQASRWLLYINGFDDISLKSYTKASEGEEKISAKRGWLGQLGLITLVGHNLFETLMLNMVMINDNAIQNNQNPIWEHESVSIKERNLLFGIPDNLAELYTVQFRRILLQKDIDKVTGYIEVVGDIFPNNVVLYEPMTVRTEIGKTDKTIVPKKHNPSMQMWRNFASLYNYSKDDVRKAGVIRWFEDISQFLSPDDYIKTEIASVVYDEKQGASLPIINVFSDSLSMHSAILTELGENWRADIEREIEKCSELASAVQFLAKNLYIAGGGSEGDKDPSWKGTDEQLYYRLDMPFRRWLYGITPDKDKDGVKKIWRKQAKSIALSYGEELLKNVPEAAIIGRIVTDKDKKGFYYSAPKAYNIFRGEVNKIYNEVGDK